MIEVLVPFKIKEEVIEIKTIQCAMYEFDDEINMYLGKGWIIYSNIIFDSESRDYHIILAKTEKVKSVVTPPIYLEAN